MHRCLSCNQSCRLFSEFCAAYRAAPEGVVLEGQPEMVKAGCGSDSQGDSGVCVLEKVDHLVRAEGTGNKEGVSQAIHPPMIPPRPRRVMPRSVKRALLVFCLVGALALLTDGILLALSLMRPHAAVNTRHAGPGIMDQHVASPASGRSFLTPTGAASAARASAESMLTLSSQRLAFNATQGQSILVSQIITLSAHQQGFSWRIEPGNEPSAWLHLSAWQGSAAPGATASFAVNAHPAGLVPGLYTTSVRVKAFDSRSHALAGSPATLVVTLRVHVPCSLSVAPEKLSFAAVLVSAPSPQTLTLSASSGCAFPVYWQVSTDVSWLTFSHSSGTVSASGISIVVQASSSDTLLGSSTGRITFRAADSSGAPLVVSPATIIATLTVIA